MKDLVRALAVLVEPVGDGTAAVARALGIQPPEPWEHDDLFLQQLYPYASVYLGGEGKMGGDARDRVAGVWRALEQTPPAEPDHLAILLGLYARLLELERDADEPAAAAWRNVRLGLLDEHLLSWLPLWLARARELAPTSLRAWAELVERWLRDEAEAAESGRADERPPLQLRQAPALEAPAAVGGDEFIEQLLAPVRTGMILARDDLARAARDRGLALRVGERRWVLRAMLSQDAAATLDWLGAEAERQKDLPTGWPERVAAFWQSRAAATAGVLGAITAEELTPGEPADA